MSKKHKGKLTICEIFCLTVSCIFILYAGSVVMTWTWKQSYILGCVKADLRYSECLARYELFSGK